MIYLLLNSDRCNRQSVMKRQKKREREREREREKRERERERERERVCVGGGGGRCNVSDRVKVEEGEEGRP